MNALNVSISFALNLIRCKDAMKLAQNAQFVNKLCEVMIINHATLFPEKITMVLDAPQTPRPAPIAKAETFTTTVQPTEKPVDSESESDDEESENNAPPLPEAKPAEKNEVSKTDKPVSKSNSMSNLLKSAAQVVKRSSSNLLNAVVLPPSPRKPKQESWDNVCQHCKC